MSVINLVIDDFAKKIRKKTIKNENVESKIIAFFDAFCTKLKKQLDREKFRCNKYFVEMNHDAFI